MGCPVSHMLLCCCVVSECSFGADPSLSVRGFSADAHKDSSDDSEEEQQHQAALSDTALLCCADTCCVGPAQCCAA